MFFRLLKGQPGNGYSTTGLSAVNIWLWINYLCLNKPKISIIIDKIVKICYHIYYQNCLIEPISVGLENDDRVVRLHGREPCTACLNARVLTSPFKSS